MGCMVERADSLLFHSRSLGKLQSLVACICWQIWKARNAWVYKQEWWKADDIAEVASKHCTEYVDALGVGHLSSRKSKEHVTHQSIVWNSPPISFVKINCDDAFDSKSCTGGGGIVVHNHAGSVLKGAGFLFPYVSHPSLAEALILRKGLLQALQWGFDRVIFETDAEVMVKAILKSGPCPPYLNIVVDDMNSSFSSVLLSSVCPS
ncbi:uncharacterized protein LOC132316706 [Cornus florida]|uniref:uncharacterized protein LOC132316706 n=1 Tax=Cornus florida TaxID=4283 RepID=UPI0028A224D1|nr:uncharacterized protein LOC132316706 [Cornus florida]